MRLELMDWGSPNAIEYNVLTGGKLIEQKRLVFDKDVVYQPENATEEMPYAGDVLQEVVDRYGITNPIITGPRFMDMAKNVALPEHNITFTKGQAVWFPVENGIKITDPLSEPADPAMGYVKYVDENGVIEINVRKVYKRINPPNIADESRKMQDVKGTVNVVSKYCFENRQNCMDYILAASGPGNRKELFRAEIDDELHLTNEDLASIEMVDGFSLK